MRSPGDAPPRPAARAGTRCGGRGCPGSPRSGGWSSRYRVPAIARSHRVLAGRRPRPAARRRCGRAMLRPAGSGRACPVARTGTPTSDPGRRCARSACAASATGRGGSSDRAAGRPRPAGRRSGRPAPSRRARRVRPRSSPVRPAVLAWRSLLPRVLPHARTVSGGREAFESGARHAGRRATPAGHCAAGRAREHGRDEAGRGE